jgi:hypothetical protein
LLQIEPNPSEFLRRIFIKPKSRQQHV